MVAFTLTTEVPTAALLKDAALTDLAEQVCEIFLRVPLKETCLAKFAIQETATILTKQVSKEWSIMFIKVQNQLLWRGHPCHQGHKQCREGKGLYCCWNRGGVTWRRQMKWRVAFILSCLSFLILLSTTSDNSSGISKSYLKNIRALTGCKLLCVLWSQWHLVQITSQFLF